MVGLLSVHLRHQPIKCLFSVHLKRQPIKLLLLKSVSSKIQTPVFRYSSSYFMCFINVNVLLSYISTFYIDNKCSQQFSRHGYNDLKVKLKACNIERMFKAN